MLQQDRSFPYLFVLSLLGIAQKHRVENKAYFRVEDYIPASLIERMTALRVQAEVSEMHRLSPVLWGEDAELEFLRVTQQLPEYGVLVYQVLPEKMRPEGEMALGICAKGVIVYEVRNNSRIATLRFQWREIEKILAYRKKFIITSSITGKKHTFVTDSAKTCKYLLGLCCAQHGFNAQMSSPGVTPDYDKCLQMANLSLAHLARSKPLSWIQRLSCSENALFVPRLEDAAGGMVQTSLDNLTVEVSKETGAQGLRGSPCPGHEQLENICLIQKPTTCDPLSGLPVRSVRTGPQNNKRSFTAEPDREIVHVTLNRDPRRGFGGQILALNHISLEGFTFDMAVRMIQNSPDNVELIISQSKGVCGNTSSEEKKSTANSRVCSTDSLSDGHRGGLPSHTQDQERISEELGMARTQSLMPGLRPQLSTLPLKLGLKQQLIGFALDNTSRRKKMKAGFGVQRAGAGSRPSSPSETNTSEIYFVELVKEDGTLGFSVTGGINTSVPCGGIYVKSIVPGGPAAKEGRILQGDRLLQVDGVSLCGLTHKQAVQCLKGSGQVARLVLERRGPRMAQQCPSANNRMGDECTAVSLATVLPGRPASCVLATDGPKFEVKLKKNISGLGFSFVQMEREHCGHLRNDLLRIKRLFPGQPAEENGAIAAGDIILAVNGRPTEGLDFQEVLHLLRGASQEVTLLLCRPPPGTLPEMDQGWQTPVLSADKEFTRATCTDSEQSPSLDREDSQKDSASPDAGVGLGLRPESFQPATREAQWDQDTERPWDTSLTCPQDSYPHLCRLHREVVASALATSLEKDVRQNCYSVCDIRRLERSHTPDLCRPPPGTLPEMDQGWQVRHGALQLSTDVDKSVDEIDQLTITEGWISFASHDTGPKFEVKLKKNISGLGFSFVQMEREHCGHLRNDLLRIKRLFPGQPAEENGAIAAGDIILAVNGRPTEGLDFQTPVLSADKEFTRATCTDSEQSPSLDREDSQKDSASPDAGVGLGLRPESFQPATREAQWDQDTERPWDTSLTCPQDSYPHLCRLHREVVASALATSLEKDVRQNCYSVCDIRRLER
ncbi:FERM and PDZ domain-containing protein 2 [Camelus dromedarius]|uniref:FERM and PDZ domain-containing protein 2 n=1 Tax=Camelus dromedarius TaxID=9838 RepID=A0A5N4DJP9_CAMDR|nr:FERM and PDZ domain-containing protein 2 [Camelus dromedarius]